MKLFLMMAHAVPKPCCQHPVALQYPIRSYAILAQPPSPPHLHQTLMLTGHNTACAHTVCSAEHCSVMRAHTRSCMLTHAQCPQLQAPEKAAAKGKAGDPTAAQGTPAPKQSVPTNGSQAFPAVPAPPSANAALGAVSAAKSNRAHPDARNHQQAARYAQGMPSLTLIAALPAVHLWAFNTMLSLKRFSTVGWVSASGQPECWQALPGFGWLQLIIFRTGSLPWCCHHQQYNLR